MSTEGSDLMSLTVGQEIRSVVDTMFPEQDDWTTPDTTG
jgi:hypothetical protein